MISILPTIGVAMPTDADWGRLYKFDTTGDSGIIMPPRSYYFRQFIPGNYVNLAIGMIFATCGNTGDTSTLNDERLNSSSPANLFHFGLSNALSTNTIDVATNPNFAGIRAILSSNTQLLASSKTVTQTKGTLVSNGVTQTGGSIHDFNLTEGVTATPFNMIGLRFVFDPIAQILYMNRAVSNGIALADDDANVSTLETFLLSITNDIVTPYAALNLASIANLKTFYVYWPYILNRLKLHCVGALKLN